MNIKYRLFLELFLAANGITVVSTMKMKCWP